MIGHFFKLVWNRKRSSALVILEIFCSFLVIFVITTAATSFASNYRRPLGFDCRNVWNVALDMRIETDDTWTPEMVTRFNSLLREARAIPQVEAAAGAQFVPFEFSDSTGNRRVGGKDVEVLYNEVTDNFPVVMNMKMASGRWFTSDDDTATWEPVVMNRLAAQAFFGTDDPVGRIFEEKSDGDRPAQPWRVVGVVDHFRKRGELHGESAYVFRRKRLELSSAGPPRFRPARNIVIRMKPGTSIEVEKLILSRLRGVAGDWGLEVKTLEQLREENVRLRLIPVIIASIIAGFMLLMVALGLLGVLWQSVQRRTAELALRRALGATGAQIQNQIMTETAIMATFALVAGVVLVAQFPILGLITFIPPGVFVISILESLLLMYGFVLASSYYPSRIATLALPATALRAE